MDMLKTEWKKLVSNKMLLISCMVMLFIPIMYAGFFLKSNWDPYGNTDKLSVAVVNLDHSVDYQGTQLDIGSDVVDKLKKNDALDWHFVSQEEAQKGLENREYYMVMTLPTDFSTDAATLMETNPKKMIIDYETNGSLNYIGEVISKSAAKDVKAEVSANVTKAYTEAIFEQLGTIGTGFSEAAEGAGEIDEGTGKLAEGSQELTKNLEKLSSSTITFEEGTQTLEVGLKEYTAGVSQVNNGADQLNKGINQLSSKVKPLENGGSLLENGSTDLTNGLKAYTAGVSQLADGTKVLNENSSALQAGTVEVSNGVDQVKSGSDQLLTGLNQLSSELDSSLSNENAEQLQFLMENLSSMNDGIQKLDAVLNGQTDGTDFSGIQTNLQQSGVSLNEVAQDIGKTGEDLTKLTSEVNALEGTIQADNDATISALSSTTAFDSLTTEQQNELVNAVESTSDQKETEITAIKDQIGVASKDINDTAAAANETGTSLTDLQTELAAVSGLTEQLTALKMQVDTLAQSSNQLLPATNQTINELITGLTGIQSALERQGTNSDKGIIQGMTELNQGLVAIQSGLSGENGLVEGVTNYTNGVNSLQTGADELNANSTALNTGSEQLNSGIGQLTSQLPNLIAGIDQLNSGSNQLAQGASLLNENSASLTNGATSLADGSTQLKEGSQALSSGSQTLGNGIETLKDGTNQLSTSLLEGSAKVNEVDATDKTMDMFSNPIELKQEKYSEVPNYGAALAPYIMSMALYIGAVVFTTIYPVRKRALEGKSGFEWWLSKVSVAILVATLMAVLECGILLMIGLEVLFIGKFFLLAVLTSLAFMSIVLTLVVALDNVGRFLAMILLVLQLGGSGGTFPIPLTNGFFQSIHLFLPMTYSVYGFRQAISDGLGNDIYWHANVVMIGIIILFNGLLIVTMHFLQKKNQKNEENELNEIVNA
ncbi:YhgE/Pip domain-containing protein [Carnobacterium viridans]|uniref:Putative membrane protein n=1 Tax=Carnobacterium viridans TaxID=174587 RepID=A0A1H0Z2U6_9LACT|nr:YhgE/Pip domain-containing protein [Carnobacterium viridans]UDE94835.1 YhgE/Pip domain-containing protein [Carnobacterium viridans]SDQ21461.1 putative membrane protein [Carnobacterium viridans]